jgi:hypothetical protein
MDTADNRLRAKLESLLRLAEDPQATPEERDLAMQRVLQIAEKYQVDASNLDPRSGQYKREEIVTHVFQIPSTYGLTSTRGHGLYDVLRAMGGNGYARVPAGQKRGEELVAYAPESTMNVLKVLLPSLLLQEANASAAYIKYLKETHSGLKSLQKVISQMRAQKADPRDFTRHYNSEIRYRRKSFCLAFFVEAAEKIRVTRKDAVQQAGKGYALVLVDVADRIAAMLAEISGLREQEARGRWSQEGWESGTAAGRQAMVGQTEVHGGRPALEQ